MTTMDICDIAVVGAGPSGAMAAIRAGQLKRKVTLVERNDSIGRKVLLTGRGRCNVTNTAPIDELIAAFGKDGRFLRSAFFSFSGEDLMEFFRSNGLELKAERQGRVFPVTDKALSVVEILRKCLAENKVDVRYNRRLTALGKAGGCFKLDLAPAGTIRAKKVILATGGASFKGTGSTGDGYRIAERLGHRIVPLRPALVPLRTREKWVADLQGLSLKNIRLTFEYGGKKTVSGIGEFLFTHFGVSGPLVLDSSGVVTEALVKEKEVRLLIDLKPALTIGQLDDRLLAGFRAFGRGRVKNVLKGLLPQRLIEVFMRLAGLGPDKEANQVTQKERGAMVNLLKAMPLTITGSLPVEEAMVTAGGIPADEIDPRTMESKVVAGLYFAGEIINGCAPSGGYNLQKAFSTGYLAGEKAAACVK